MHNNNSNPEEKILHDKFFSASNKNINSDNNFTNKVFTNDDLYKQYIMLEEVFKKVNDVSMYHSNTLSISKIFFIIYLVVDRNNFSHIKNLELFELDQCLNSKREILTNKLKDMKNRYFYNNSRDDLNNYTLSNEGLGDSLMNQIDILIDLISVTKKKINLMQEIEKDMK